MSIFKNSYHSLYGAWRLAHFDPEGMAFFDISESGFWRSFQAALVGLPIFVILSVLEKHLRVLAIEIIAPGEVINVQNYYLLQVLDYIVTWPAFALTMIPICRLSRLDERYAALVISYNWARVMTIVILIPPYLLLVVSGGLNILVGLLTFVASVFVLGYQWFVVKTAIGGSKLTAVAIVIIDILLAGIVSYIMTSLFGGVFVGAQ